MLSSDDLERLIEAKKREIEREKTLLGLSPPPIVHDAKEDKENGSSTDLLEYSKKVNFKEAKVLSEHNAKTEEEAIHKSLHDIEEKIPPDLERYIRRYVGLPVMLKAGEYSPNNPLVRSEHVPGDALLGLGEYERRTNTLRKIRQAQYREYLDQQAKKKQEAKEQADRERREREEKDRVREERERQLLLERERYSPDRRASVTCAPVHTKVDTGVQVDRMQRPLSVAVQTDIAEIYGLSPSPLKAVSLTQAERELSPRTVEPRPQWDHWDMERRRSHGDFDERTSSIKKNNREKLISDLRHSYMPSIFDADAIHLRNVHAEQAAAEKRHSYRQELAEQIQEQQRIREERKSREKMLEQAEMRRLEEQLRMLRVAQEREVGRHHDITAAMKTNAYEYEKQRKVLQEELNIEEKNLFRTTSQPLRNLPRRKTLTSQSDNTRLPLYYPEERIFKPIEKHNKPYSFNIPENSIFSQNYDVDSYLRKNLNFKNKMAMENNSKQLETPDSFVEAMNTADSDHSGDFDCRNVIVEKALVHEPRERKVGQNTVQNTEKSVQNTKKSLQNSEKSTQNMVKSIRNTEKPSQIPKKLPQNPEKSLQNPEKSLLNPEKLSIPVLRHSPKGKYDFAENSPHLSEAMKKVDDKWKVPAVQKNILTSLPIDNGKNISILTQLGSIRRQLQLEQLKLDKMLDKTKNDT